MTDKTGLPAVVKTIPENYGEFIPAHLSLDRGVLSISRDMVSVLGFDGLLRDVNPAWEQVFGHSRTELIDSLFLIWCIPTTTMLLAKP